MENRDSGCGGQSVCFLRCLSNLFANHKCLRSIAQTELHQLFLCLAWVFPIRSKNNTIYWGLKIMCYNLETNCRQTNWEFQGSRTLLRIMRTEEAPPHTQNSAWYGFSIIYFILYTRTYYWLIMVYSFVFCCVVLCFDPNWTVCWDGMRLCSMSTGCLRVLYCVVVLRVSLSCLPWDD